MGFRRAWRARLLQYMRRDFGLSGRLRRRKPGVEPTQMGHEADRCDPGACGGLWGAFRRRSRSSRSRESETVHSQMGLRFDEMGQACSNGTGNPRFGTPMPEWSHGRERQGPGRPEFQPGCGGTAPTGADRPDRSIALGPPDQRRGKSRDNRMLDWDATARLTPLPARRHVSRAPAPSRPRSRHCAAAGSPSRCAATVSSEYHDSCRIFQIVSF